MAEALLQLEDGNPGWVQALGWTYSTVMSPQRVGAMSWQTEQELHLFSESLGLFVGCVV